MNLRHAVLPLLAAAALPALSRPSEAATRGLQARDLAPLDRHSSPTLSPDGRHLVFAKRVVDFDANKSSTSLLIEDLFARDSAPPKALTPAGWNVNSPSFSPDGKPFVFSGDIFPECGIDFACTSKRLAAVEAQKTSGVVYDQLFIRHW